MRDIKDSGTIAADSKTLLAEVLVHMQRQNEHQVEQLKRGDDLLEQLTSTNRRVNVLVAAALLLLALGGLHQTKITQVVTEQLEAQKRAATLEKAVDAKIETGTTNIVKKVEEISNTAPKIVKDDTGALSLSLPIAIAAEASASAEPVTKQPSTSLAPGERLTGAAPRPRAIIKGSGQDSDRVLLPLE